MERYGEWTSPILGEKLWKFVEAHQKVMEGRPNLGTFGTEAEATPTSCRNTCRNVQRASGACLVAATTGDAAAVPGRPICPAAILVGAEIRQPESNNLMVRNFRFATSASKLF